MVGLRLKYLVIITLVVIGLTSSRTRSQDVRAYASVDTGQILIGDWIGFHVSVEHNPDIAVAWPIVGDSIGTLEVVRQDSVVRESENEIVVERRTYTLAAFDSGLHVIPPLAFAYRTAADTTQQLASTLPIFLHVAGVAVDTTEDIKDIKPPLGMPISLAELLPYLVGIVVVAGLSLAISYVVKKRRSGESLFAPSVPLRPAHEVALDALRALEADHLWQRSKVKEYYSLLTEIVRAYIERRFDVLALESTSDEILSFAQIRQLDRDIRSDLEEILLRGDLVKFAKFQPLAEENDRSMRLAISFVESTILREPKPSIAEKLEVEVQ